MLGGRLGGCVVKVRFYVCVCFVSAMDFCKSTPPSLYPTIRLDTFVLCKRECTRGKGYLYGRKCASVRFVCALQARVNTRNQSQSERKAMRREEPESFVSRLILTPLWRRRRCHMTDNDDTDD